MLRFTFSLLLLFLVEMTFGQIRPGAFQSGNLGGQSGGSSSGTSKPVTMKEMRALRKQETIDWSINYVKFSYDLIPTGRVILKPDQKGQEIQASISFYKYFFMVEGGFQDFTRGNSFFDYNSSGSFFRLGPEVNLIKLNPQGGAFTFGIRYAQSNFHDQFSFIKDTGFGTENYGYQNPNARLIWMELTTGLNLPVGKNIHMGYTIRYKAFRSVKGIDVLKPFDVPGFGRYENRTTLGFSYYIGWAIPLKKLEEVSDSAE